VSLRHFIVIAAVAVSACQAPSVALQSRTSNAKEGPSLELCDVEGMQALDIAREYIVLHGSRERLLAEAKDSSSEAVVWALTERADQGRIESHVHFATEKLFACASHAGVNVRKSPDEVRLCYARVDVPFFLTAQREVGATKSAAIATVGEILNDRTFYPQELIEAVANAVYDTSRSSDKKQLMSKTFWSCFNEGQ
jgi:hypothetical protein